MKMLLLTKHKDYRQLNIHHQDFQLVVQLVVRQGLRKIQELLHQYLEHL
jgi:hypothetical protein